MILNISQIRSITCGAERVEQRPEGVWFQRMTDEQLEVYREPNPAFYNKALTTAGVMLSFETDSANMELDISIIKVMGRSYGTVEVFCDGKALENINNYSHMNLPRDYAELSYPEVRKEVSYALGEGKKHICIYLPRLTGVYLHKLALEDGAAILPVKPSQKALVFGDSITQGFDCLRPTSHYVHALCQVLGAEEYNKGVGGEQHAPALAQCAESFYPDYIVVGYGTNDWRASTPERLERKCKEFYQILAEKYPNVPVISITPVWRSNIEELKDIVFFEHFHDVEDRILQITAQYPNVTVVKGFHLIPHDVINFGDYGLHPSDLGFAHYGKNLLAALREQGFPME